VTRFEIDGQAYGGDYDPAGDVRLTAFWQAFPDARRVLEIGSLEGGHTLQLAARAAEVVAVESRPSNLRRAKHAQRLLGATGIRWVQADVEQADLTVEGEFDAIFCAGVLYHLPEPSKLLDQMVRLAPGALIWTHVAQNGSEKHDGFVGEWFAELGVGDPTSGMSSRSFWPTRESLVARLRRDYGDVDVVQENRHHPNGHALTIVVRR
jgi:SAM-dependent methyltransferase